MYSYNEIELQRIARIRSTLPAHLLADIGALNRIAVEARSATMLNGLSMIGRFVGKVVGKVKARIAYRRAVDELNQLDARILADIGIERADIPRVAAGSWVPAPQQLGVAGVKPANASNQNARRLAA